jgi:hypothetical protein
MVRSLGFVRGLPSLAETDLLNGKCRIALMHALQGEHRMVLFGFADRKLTPIRKYPDVAVDTGAMTGQAKHAGTTLSSLNIVRSQKVAEYCQSRARSEVHLFSSVAVELCRLNDTRFKRRSFPGLQIADNCEETPPQFVPLQYRPDNSGEAFVDVDLRIKGHDSPLRSDRSEEGKPRVDINVIRNSSRGEH